MVVTSGQTNRLGGKGEEKVGRKQGRSVGMPRLLLWMVRGHHCWMLDGGVDRGKRFECTRNHLRDVRELATEMADAIDFPPSGPNSL